MPDPEYFLGAYSEAGDSAWQTTAFSDVAVPDGSGHRAIWERKPLFCVPVPGQDMPKATPGAPGINSLILVTCSLAFSHVAQGIEAFQNMSIAQH